MVVEGEHPQADGNASFLRAARSGNLEKVIEFLKGTIDINTSNANGLNALHLAAKEGHVNVVTELIKRGANVNAATKKGNTALHIASLAGQEEVVKVLVKLGANVNVQSQNGFTPLYMAAQENHDAVVSFLLANGANQSLATEDGFTPLAVALQQGHDKVVAVLLENDTKGKVRLPALHIAAKKDDCKAATLLLQSDHNPDVTSKSGFTPLHIAAHYGNENIAKILLTKGADVNYAAKHQITPLHVASKWGKINMVTLLLEKGAHIDASTRDGLTPLHCAARSGHDQVVDLLLEKGAPFLAKTKNGLAPLHMASQGDHVDSARILLYHKAPVDDVTVDYLTALHVAAHCGHVKVAKLLLDRKADPNARALNGFTPLHIACKKNRIKVVELLLKHGASIEATTESGLTPLHVASFMGCMNIVIYLIQNGSNPDVPTVRGETPLHLAARANQTDIIRILLRNGASVDARAREEQTPLHIAARLGNVDIVSLLLQHGAAVDAVTKDMYTPLHITAKEDQEEVAATLLDHGASLTATTKKGFTPLHLAAKYGNIKVARLLLQKGAPVDAQGKNGVTPLHVAAHYDHVNVALLLLDKGASPHAMAKNGYTPLHIAAKKNQMDIASTLLEYGANTNSESKAGFTPLHLSAQEGHADMSSLLIENKANVNHKANNGLTPLHLCAQDDRVNVAQVLVKNGAEICPQTKAGYTPLHVASHFGQINMVRFLLQNDANVHTVTSHGYTPLHQAAQQGHTLVVNLLLENQASPNVTTVQGQTPLSIAQRLGYISVVETLKVVTETTVTTTTTTVTEEKYKVVAPETMQETFMTDSEDEGGADFDEAAIFGKPTHATHIYLPYVEGQNFYMSEEAMLGDQSYRYLTADEMKSLGDDSLPIDVTKDEKQQDAVQAVKQFVAPMVEEDNISPQHGTPVESGFSEKFSPDNIDLVKAPVHAGMDDAYYYLPPKGMLRSSRLKWKTFLVSFMVDARGGAMRGCRHSGVRVIIPPRKASMPMRITCRYLRKEKLIHPPPLMEGEACASRILEMGPVGARFLGPVIIEVPHFASTRGKEREITILRSDTGESWREHTLEASEEAVQEVLNESFEGEELSALEDLNTNRITRILTTDFPQYFAIVTRIRQEVHGVGPEGGMVSSTVVPQVQAIFPEGALTKKIRVGLQAQPIAPELVTKLLGNRVAVSPIVTVEPRRRKFHKPITLTIPVPQAATKGMINQYSGDAPTLRLLCSITGSTKSGGSSKAQWEDVTGSTPLTFVNDCVSFTTTVSARFWLMDCRQVNEVTRFATELYQEAVYVPFMSKFVIFAKRHDPFEAQLRVFCMTDDKEDKTLESQEHFTEVAKSRDVEVLEGKLQYLEFAGNLVPVTKSGEQLKLTFQAFHENRLPFIIRVKDPHAEPMGRIAFMKEPKAGRGEPPQTPICNLNVALPDITLLDSADVLELVTLEKRYDFIQEAGLSKPELIHRADLRLSDIARELDKDWILLAQQLDVQEQDVEQIKAQTICDQSEQARMMLRLWLHKSGPKATGNELEKGLRKINREDIIKNCMFNVELVTDDVEKAVAKVHLDQSGFDVFKEELGSSREASMRRGTSLDDEQDIMKEAESAAETSSETGSLFERDHLSQALSDERDEFAMLSVHETALSDTDAPFNSNKPAFDDSNNILKSLNNCNFDEDISKSNYDSYSSEGNTLLFSQTSGKMHDFWPPGMIIQTPLAVSEISDISSPDKFEDTVEKESALNGSFQSNIAFESDMPSELKSGLTDNESFVDTKEILNNESVEYNNIINASIDVSIDNPYESSDFNFPIKTDEPNSNSYENKYDEEIEYVASLEPDVDIADETIDNFLPSDINYKSGSKGVIIEEVPSSNGSEPGEPRFPFQSPGVSCPMSGNNNKFPSLDAEQNLYPIEENERDECDAVTESGTIYETSLHESINSYNIMQNELNNISSVSIEPHDKIYNGFKHETSTEASDLGYFSLDKDSSLSSTSAISEEKIKQLESELFSSIFEDKNRLNEKISVSILPEISSDIQSTMKVFVDKEDGKLKYGELDEYTTQIAIDKDKLQDLSFKSSDACIKEENKIVKNEEYSYPKDAKIRRASKTPPPSPIDETVDKGGIELEKLQEISNLLPEYIESEIKKPEEFDFRKVEVIVKEHVVIQEIPSKLTESETWQSGDLDTSQVSVSSLPEDDKSEPTTTTVSSTAVQEITKSIVPDTEIMDVDKSGTTTHIIQKTTHMTLVSHATSDNGAAEDSAGKSSTDLNENEDKSKHLEEIKVVSGELEMTTKSSELPKNELDAAVGSTQVIPETDEKHSGAHVEALHPETDTVDSEELCKITKDVYISEKDSDLMAETQHSEKSVSSFTSCAFINTAFAGADAIDEVEQVSPVRARSPYEVIRGKDDHVSDGSPDDKTSLSTSDRVTYVTKHVEIRRRPLLQHIPSEISEEDLVEREIISPIHELELSDQPAETESGILRFDTYDVSGIKTIPLETKVSEVSTYTVVKNVSMPVEAEDKIVKTEPSDVTVVKTVTVTKVEHAGYADQSSDYQYITSIKDRPGDIQIKSDISEILAKAKDITTPESDTGIPTSPFELVSESEMSDIEHKFSTSAVSHSSAKSEKGDKSKDSVITTTHSQSITDKTVSVSIPSSEEHKDSLTLNGKSESSKTEDVSRAAEHSTVNITSDDKPLTNGPGEVEYHPEYDYDGESISKKFEHVYAERSVYETPETDEGPKCHYSSVSDDVIDSEIREILSSDQQLEDIIERPVTPEPPRDDIRDIGFVSRLKRPSDGEIEGLMREEGFAYSDDAPLSSPTSPDSKSGFAYGMHFEKYVIDEGEEAMDIDSDQFSEEKEPPYSYDMTFEHEPELEEDVPCYGDLYTHEEEDEDVLENGEKSKVLQKLNSKDSEFDILAGRKYFSKNVEIDELSMSSLQEFERLEAEIVSGRKSSVGSLDSLNGKQLTSKSGDHDDVSMSSLTEFERIEKECTEGDKIDPSMQESITQLSEIEEGHESQASEASQENKSDVGRMEDISLADDYSNQLENIEELILEVESKKTDELPFQIMMKQTQKTEQTGHGIEITSKEKQIDNKISDISKETVTKTSTVTQVSKIPCWTTSKSLESSSLGDARDDLDQDSLRDELSLKPDSLIDDTKLDFQDSLHEERFDDADSLQENIDEMRDSLFEERHIEDDSLHEMDIMPDESSLSLEGSLPAIASLDSSKADEPIKLTITNLTDSKGIQPEIILGSETENFQIRQTQINISDFPRGADIMQSSTDSLEQSSSALAAFQIESESLMSSSLNSAITSGEDNTMVSSSDTIEPEGRITYRYEDIPVDDIEMLVRSGHRVIVDSEGNIQAHYEGKPCIETEEIRNTALGFHKDTTEIKLPPTTTVQVHSALTTVGYVNGRKDQEKHFHHTSGEEDYESFESSHFDPDVEVEEIQTTDEFGNTKIIRKIKKVSHTKTQFSSSSSPKNVEEQLKEFLREHTAGDKASSAEEEIEEQKTTDEKGNVVVIRTVKRHIHTEPEVHSKTFTGPTADQQSKKFVETFQTLDPTEDVSEYEKVDEQGNVVRVTEKFVVTPKVHTVSFSGPDAHKQMEDYMKQWTLQSQNLGEFEGDQQRAMLPSLQTGRTFEQSETSAPSDSSEHLVQNVIGDTIVTKTLSSTFSADSSEKIEIPESSTSTTTISIETVRSKSDSSEDTKSMPK